MRDLAVVCFGSFVPFFSLFNSVFSVCVGLFLRESMSHEHYNTDLIVPSRAPTVLYLSSIVTCLGV